MSSTTADSVASLRGRTAVVTGASRGIGLECARVLSGAGARVVLVARGKDTLDDATEELGALAESVVCDMADPAAVQRAMAQIQFVLGGAPDILVNNAGQFFLARVEDTPVDEFALTVQVNLTAQFAFIQRFVPDMRKRHHGHIVTIGSIADHRAFPENAAYAASKFGARGLHEVLREELRGSGVRATLVSPGPVDTALWDEVNPDERPGFTPRAQMLPAAAVADAVRYVVTRPVDVNIDELRVSHA
jgi:NADP-dependent 3-hydroxy acid dehydrogenase YdfG